MLNHGKKNIGKSEPGPLRNGSGSNDALNPLLREAPAFKFGDETAVLVFMGLRHVEVRLNLEFFLHRLGTDSRRTDDYSGILRPVLKLHVHAGRHRFEQSVGRSMGDFHCGWRLQCG